ncbi:hypothetical protein HK101_004281 [Irineochytrium annulatum]|nr:hypothetical protein HK101_004281 [Irineochytrium annulatum]
MTEVIAISNDMLAQKEVHAIPTLPEMESVPAVSAVPESIAAGSEAVAAPQVPLTAEPSEEEMIVVGGETEDVEVHEVDDDDDQTDESPAAAPVVDGEDEIQQRLRIARTYSQEGSMNKRPTWNWKFVTTVKTLTGLFHKYKNDIDTGRKILNNTRFPKPIHVSVKKVHIPRRADARPLNMDASLATGNLKAEWIDASTSTTASNDKVILYAHGGVYVMCSRKTHRAVTWRLAKRSGARVLSIDYRLAPEHSFPTPINDMLSAYLYLIDPPAGHTRYDPANITFMGDSAGGNLCASTCLWLRQDGRWPQPAGLGLICPWMDLTHSQPSYVLNGPSDYLPVGSEDPKYLQRDQVHYFLAPGAGVSLAHELVSPMFANVTNEGKDDQGQPLKPLPPILIQCGDAERLRDETLETFERWGKQGANKVQVEVWEDMIHVWHLFAVAENVSRAAIAHLADFAVKVTGRKDGEAVEFERSVRRVRNRAGYPCEEFGEDVGVFLSKERERLEKFVNENAEKLKAAEPKAAPVVVKEAKCEAEIKEDQAKVEEVLAGKAEVADSAAEVKEEATPITA